ncbi:MAG: lipid biosynthesis B12-binding/radical SAM protein [Thermodesulfobacteriota bacterium]
MSRIFLLSTNTMTDPYAVYPLGLSIVAAALISAGHRVKQFDFLTEGQSFNRLDEALQRFGPDFVGVSLRNIDNVDSFTSEESWALHKDREIIRRIKGTVGVPVIVGGSAFSIMPEEILSYVGADYGIVGDGGFLFCDWIGRFEQGHPLPKIFQENRSLDTGDTHISPCWDQTIIRHYAETSRMVGMRTKRGCPHHCAYCTYPSLEGNRYRLRRPEEVVEDVIRLKKDYGVETVFFTDSVFNDPGEHYLAIAEELIRRETGLPWSAFFQPGRTGERELQLLKRSGLYAVESGTDASSEATLEGLNKSFHFDEVVEFNNICLGQEIPCVHYVMFGGPGESDRTVREGLENIKGLTNCVVLGFSGVRIFPGTLLERRAVEEGVIGAQDSLLKPVFYFSPAVDVQKMNEAISEAFKHQRQRVFPPSAGRQKLEILNRFGFRGPLWDKLVSFKKGRKNR